MIVLLVLAAALALADWVGVARDDGRLRWIGKPGTMIALAAAAVSGSDGVPDGIRWWIVAGLLLSLAGDVVLLLSERRFVAGLGSFLLAHVAYIVAMQQVGTVADRLVAGIVFAGALGLIAGRSIVEGAGEHDPAMRIPVAAYLLVISTMAAMAIGTGEPWLIVAAALFYCSDAILGWNRFVQARRWMPLAVMVTYHLAQSGFVAFLVTR
ncbi:MAG: lysoplasmalogenase [Acidimicrobiia bacterium]